MKCSSNCPTVQQQWGKKNWLAFAEWLAKLCVCVCRKCYDAERTALSLACCSLGSAPTAAWNSEECCWANCLTSRATLFLVSAIKKIRENKKWIHQSWELANARDETAFAPPPPSSTLLFPITWLEAATMFLMSFKICEETESELETCRLSVKSVRLLNTFSVCTCLLWIKHNQVVVKLKDQFGVCCSKKRDYVRSISTMCWRHQSEPANKMYYFNLKKLK